MTDLHLSVTIVTPPHPHVTDINFPEFISLSLTCERPLSDELAVGFPQM